MKILFTLIVLLCLSCANDECSESVSYKSNVEAVIYRHQNGKPSHFFEIEKCYPSGVDMEFYDNGIIASYGYHTKDAGSSSEWLVYDTTGMLLCKQIHKYGRVSTVSTIDGRVVFLTDSEIIMNSANKKLQLIRDSITYGAHPSDLKIYYRQDTIIFEAGKKIFKLDSNLKILSVSYNDLLNGGS